MLAIDINEEESFGCRCVVLRLQRRKRKKVGREKKVKGKGDYDGEQKGTDKVRKDGKNNTRNK
jgi:hypothetical protein